MAADPELDALMTLVRSAGGRATVEPVTGLAIALISPWAADRTDVVDRPVRRAPTDERRLQEFLRAARQTMSPRPLPQDRGLLGWLRHTGQALPIADISRAPSWLSGDYLNGGWIALPPAGGYAPDAVGDEIIAHDGRLALLHLLCTQCGGPTSIPRDAVLALTEMFVGPRACDWPQRPAEQCPQMKFTFQHAGPRDWYRTYRSVDPVAARDFIARSVPLVHENWQVPPPTSAQLAAEQERQEILALGAVQDKAWRERRMGRTAAVGS